MKRKGFTLIEIIMVIAVIGILMLLIVPNVMLVINKNNIKSCENIEKSIIKAAELYVTDHKYELGFSCNGNTTSIKNVKLDDLVKADYLKADKTGKIINPVNDELIYEPNDATYSVNIVYHCDTKLFDYKFSKEINGKLEVFNDCK